MATMPKFFNKRELYYIYKRLGANYYVHNDRGKNNSETYQDQPLEPEKNNVETDTTHMHTTKKISGFMPVTEKKSEKTLASLLDPRDGEDVGGASGGGVAAAES